MQSLQNQSNQLQQQLTAQQNQMASLLTEIEGIREEISINSRNIRETEQNLAAAQEAERRQFEQMCKRIRYNYENKEESVFTYLFTSANFSDFLNQVEYANKVYEYDAELLESYEATRIEIEEMKADLERQKASLAMQESSLNQKQAQLSAVIEDTRSRKQNVDEDLRKAREEAARRAREEAARRERERQAAIAAANAASANASVKNNNQAGGVTNADPAPRTNVSGSSVVSYANQFVGNPYVWGGNSLTQGADCSGFVVQVYKHFGINLSGSRNSAALRSVGQAVSYDKMKAGDIVCYAGHVAIYSGSGTIVEAQSTAAGITNNRSVNSKTILAIRRVI